MKRVRGFTLIELMIVVLVIALLAGIALSGYQKQIRKSRRAEAKQVLGDFALREERFRSSNTTYATTQAALLNGGTAPALVYYTVAFSTPTGTCPDGTTAFSSANSFAFTATPTSSTGQNKDTACPTIVYTNKCGSVEKTPTDCW
jgi:type IV pilus assembly protein PilE